MNSIEIDRLKYLLKNRDDQIEALERKVQGWKADAKSWESTAASMATELDDLEQEADSLTDRNEALAELLTEAQVRAKKAEAELEKERRRAEIAESARFRSDERAEKAEAMAEREAARAAKFELQDNGCDELIAALREMLREAVERADNAEARIEELEDRIRIHKSRIQPQSSPVPKAIIDGQGDRWELNHGTGLYEFGIFNRTLDNIEMNWGIEERIYA